MIATFASFEERNDVRDRYNQAGPATWSSFAPEMTFGLGVLDALDGTCGNQLLAGPAGPNRYDALADETEGYDRNLPWQCRARTDDDGEELPEDQRVESDEQYTIRAWMAVVTYMLADYRFLYQ